MAARASAWAVAQGADLRALVVLVPFAQHLAPARRAFMQRGGWQPRVETTRTLAASLGPAPRAGEAQLSFDASTDRLHAARMLRSQSWVMRDPLAFDEAVSAVVATAHAMARAAAALAPSERAAHWQRARHLLAAPAEAGATERALARVALEWAALAPLPVTDLLFAHRPSAWVVVQAGGGDPLAAHVLAAMPPGLPCLVLDADEGVTEVLPASATMAVCDGLEEEAACAAAEVLDNVAQARVPVALVAQDRLLVRRVRALLERQGVRLQDETGWKLSTTRAAAEVMALLKAAAPSAGTDAWLDWLKAGAWPQSQHGRDELEAACRRASWTQASAIRAERLTPAAMKLWADASAVLRAFTAERRQPLAHWLRALSGALQQSEALDALATDPAGQQVLLALHLAEGAGWQAQGVAQTSMDLADFSAWVDAALEDGAFVPDSAPDADVVITPLARLMLRPFAAVVFPGADDRHLGAPAARQPLLNDAQAAAFGMPTGASQHEAETLAFAHACASGAPLRFFSRRMDGAEPLAPSPLLLRLELRLQAAGRRLDLWSDPRTRIALSRTPLRMPAPAAPGLLPSRLSASACEALRACPYRFYALHLLRLREADELDGDIEQRDYGTWLHAVLMRFHSERSEPAAAEVECARLLALAQEEKDAQGLDDADFLPFEAGFADLAPRYVDWLHGRDREGARWWQGELEREVPLQGDPGLRLYGRIDRMDHVAGPAVELIDYKTGNAAGLKDKLRQPLEDTQLAFYAALVQPDAGAPLQAAYLTLGRTIERLEHPEVEESARALVVGVAADVSRIRRGAGLPALGEPPVCDYCEARGLCRRDHWSSR